MCNKCCNLFYCIIYFILLHRCIYDKWICMTICCLLDVLDRDVKFAFSKFELCRIRIFRTSFRPMVEWICFDFDYSILYKMAFMWWCSILGPCRILLLLIAYFITFYICRALQQKQHQCIICRMHCRSLLSENSGQILLDVCKSNLNFKTEVWKFKLRLTSLVLDLSLWFSCSLIEGRK